MQGNLTIRLRLWLRWCRICGAVIAAFVFGTMFISRLHSNSPRIGSVKAETHRLLENHIIPEFELRDATIDEGLEWLNHWVEANTTGRRLRFEMWRSTNLPGGFLKQVEDRSKEGTGERTNAGAILVQKVQPLPGERRLNIKLENVPLGEALRFAMDGSDYTIGERGDTLYVVPCKGGFGPLIECTFRGYPDLSALGIRVPSAGGNFDAKPFFRMQGVRFYEGSDAYVLPNGKLIVHNVQEEIDLISAMVGNPEPTMFERMKWWVVGSWEQICQRYGAP